MEEFKSVWQMSQGKNIITVSVTRYYNVGDQYELVVYCSHVIHLQGHLTNSCLNEYQSSTNIKRKYNYSTFSNLIGAAKIPVMSTKKLSQGRRSRCSSHHTSIMDYVGSKLLNCV